MDTKEELEKKILSYRGDLETLMLAYESTEEEYSNAVQNSKKEKNIASVRTQNEELQALAKLNTSLRSKGVNG